MRPLSITIGTPSPCHDRNGPSNAEQINAFNACIGSASRTVSITSTTTIRSPSTTPSVTLTSNPGCNHPAQGDGCSSGSKSIISEIIQGVTTVATEIVRGITSAVNSFIGVLPQILPALMKGAVSLIPGLGMLAGK